MNILLLILILIFCVFLLLWFIGWSTHRTMSLDPRSEKIIKWASFKKFKKEFYKVEWVRDISNKQSFFHKEDKYNIGILMNSDRNYIHADICIVNGKSYQFNPISFILYKIFLYRNRTTYKNKDQKVNSIKQIRKIKLKKLL